MKILVVVDMQNDFISGPLGNTETKAVVPNVCTLIKNTLEENDKNQVICTYDTHKENYLETQEGKKLPVAHCIVNTDGWQLDHNVKEAVGDREVSIHKRTFGSVDLPMKIREMLHKGSDIESITLCGVCTDICVISNAMILKAEFPEMKLQVAENCCAGVTPESHTNAINAMKMCQIDIV